MDFLSRYENMQPLPEQETKPFRARDTTTHRPVLLHQLSSNPRSGRQLHLLALVLRYGSSSHPEGHNPILAIEEQGDSLWVVTEDRPELVNLWDWMERQSTKPAVSLETHRESGIPEERTAIFATRLASAGSNPLVEFGAGENENVHAGEARPVNSTAINLAEKTQAFPAAQPEQAGAGAAPNNNVPPAPAAPAPGEFTAIFQRPPAQDLPPQPPAQQESPPKAESGPDDKPGEFTMLFRKPVGGPGGDQKPRFLGFTAPTTEKTRFIETARFKTDQMLAGEMPQTEPQTPGAPKPPADFTVMFRSPQPGAVAQAQDESPLLDHFPAAESPQNSDEPAQLQPGEFTQIFQGRPAASETLRPAARQNEPGAFTRIFQIPVGSDLLTSAEQQTVFSSAPPAPPPPALEAEAPVDPPPGSIAVPPGAPASPPPPGGISGLQFKAPSIPAAPQPPRIEIPRAGGAAAPNIPSFSPPKPPSISLPKTPTLPSAEIAPGAPGPPILPLILVFGGIVLIAVLLVLFFVTKH